MGPGQRPHGNNDRCKGEREREGLKGSKGASKASGKALEAIVRASGAAETERITEAAGNASVGGGGVVGAGRNNRAFPHMMVLSLPISASSNP